MKNSRLSQIAPMLQEYTDPEQTQRILSAAAVRLQQLIQQNAGSPRAVKLHTETEIFPCISLYEAMQANGIPKKEALRFLDQSWSLMAQKNADHMKKLLSFGRLYRLYPFLFQQVAKKQFGAAAGFHARFYECGKRHCKFDMTQCLFLDTCRSYGCPELTQCFCHTDDINNQDLHPCLVWNRTCCMGNGSKYCDFDIFVSDKQKKS